MEFNPIITRMIKRQCQSRLEEALANSPAVALLGPRQVGKTTLALEIGATRPSIYLDMESQADLVKLSDAEGYLSLHSDKIVILDEIHRVPELFQSLRGIIDRSRRRGNQTGLFLLLGSASMDLLQQSGETLAGRVAYLELCPLNATEVEPHCLNSLWIRGGFPSSFLAASDALSLRWRLDFIRSYLERDVQQFGLRLPAQTLRRLWTMLAHSQSDLLNAATLARALAIDAKTVARYLDVLVDLLLIRRLQPWHQNVGKRLVKSPKIYLRDSGIAHALLGLTTYDDVLGHPVAGGSWEGFVIESLISSAPVGTEAYFYRTAAGAEIDLLLTLPGQGLWAIEIKRGLAPKLSRGFYTGCEDIQPTQRFVVYGGQECFPVSHDTYAVGLPDLCARLARAA